MIGLFINMIPIRIKSTGIQTFPALLGEVQQSSALSRKFEYLSVADIQAQTELNRDLIDHIMIFENYPVQEELKNPGQGFVIDRLAVYEQTNYDFNVMIMPGEALQVTFGYNGLVYDNERVKNIAGHLKKY